MHPIMDFKHLKALSILFLPFSYAQQPVVNLLYQFSPGTFLENLAPRTNGHVLVNEFSHPRVWSFDTTSNDQPVLVHEFPQFSGLTGITETTEDVFAIIGGNVTKVDGALQPELGSWAIWQVDLSQSETPSVSKIADVDEGILLNGMAYVPSANALLVADSVLGVVFAVDVTTGAYSVVINDTLTNACPGGSFAVNGVRYWEPSNTLYWTNSACGTLNKVQINPDGTPASPAAVVGSTEKFLDDFAIADDGYFYIADGSGNAILRMDENGAWSTFVGSLNSSEIAEPTSMQFGKTREDCKKGTLYVTTAGGSSVPVNGTTDVGAQFIAVDLKG